MGQTDRALLFRQRAADSEQKAAEARSEEMRRAWLIIARDWTTMAQREELKSLSELAGSRTTPTAPDGPEPQS